MKKIDETYVEELLSKLTLDEKIDMIHADGLFRTKGVERLGIPPLVSSDGPMGVRQEFDNEKWLPIGNTDDEVTYMPCNSALAATWNRELAYDAGCVLGEEARGRGKDVILAPGINIKKVPLCGRNFEYMSEDPYLNGELAKEVIKGIQKSDVSACVKHFAVNNQETERLSVDTYVDERSLNEIYFPAFKKAIDEGESYSIMGAYNKIFGEQCCESKYLLNEVLRKRWNYDGAIISDWGGVHDTKKAAESALDVEMSIYDNFDEYYMANPLKREIEKGNIDEKVVDDKVRNILRLMIRLKMIGDESKNRKAGCYNTREHQEKVLKTARESIILLKNEDDILPLKNMRIKRERIAVIGQNAIINHSNSGGSAEIKALYEITPLMGIKSVLGGNCKVDFEKGYYVPEKMLETETNWQEFSLMIDEEKEQSGAATVYKMKDDLEDINKIKQLQTEYRKKAIKLAKECDKVIYIGGLDHNYDVEGKDRTDMMLPYEQDILINELLDIKPDMTIVMMAGSNVDMTSWIDRAKNVVWFYYGGSEGGKALAEVLFGKISPTGKLPETMAKKLEDYYPIKLGEFAKRKKVTYKDGIYVGYRYFDSFDVEPQFCFGHGLTYTKFEYGKAEIKMNNNKISINMKIKNIGSYNAAEVLQIYVSCNNSTIKRAKQELKNFEKVWLQPNEEKEVCIELNKEDFSYYSEKEEKFVVENGEYTINIGTSSRDIKQSLSIII